MLKQALLATVALATFAGATTSINDTTQPEQARVVRHAKKKTVKKVVKKRRGKKMVKKRVVKKRVIKKKKATPKKRVVKKVVKKRVARKAGPTDGQKKALRLANTYLANINNILDQGDTGHDNTYNVPLKEGLFAWLTDCDGSAASGGGFYLPEKDAKYAIAHIDWNKVYVRLANKLVTNNDYAKSDLYSKLITTYGFTDSMANYAISKVTTANWNQAALDVLVNKFGSRINTEDTNGDLNDYGDNTGNQTYANILAWMTTAKGFSQDQAKYALSKVSFYSVED